MKYVIRSIIFNDYFIKSEPMKNNKTKLFWSQFLSEAKLFESKDEARQQLKLIQKAIVDEMDLRVEIVDPTDIWED